MKYKKIRLTQEELIGFFHEVFEHILNKDVVFDTEDEKMEALVKGKKDIEKIIIEDDFDMYNEDFSETFDFIRYSSNLVNEEYESDYKYNYYEFSWNDKTYTYYSSSYLKDQCICDPQYNSAFSLIIEADNEDMIRFYERKLVKAESKVKKIKKKLKKLKGE